MKLKEKLSDEFVLEREDPKYPFTNDYKDGLGEGFIAGFEKAREMVKKKATFNQCHECGGADEFKMYERDLDNLGEEEV